MKGSKNITPGFLKVLLLLLFVFYNGSLTLFYHAHAINGQVAYHSHPIQTKPSKNGGSPSQTHHHSPAEFFFIKQLDNSLWDNTSEFPGLPEVFLLPVELLLVDLPAEFACRVSGLVQLRAPPVIPFLT